MKILCSILGHRWVWGPQITVPKNWHCGRCGGSR